MDPANTQKGRKRFGLFEVDPESGELRKNGVKVSVQEQPFQILKALLERPGELVTRDELRRRIWPEDTFVAFDHGLYSAMTKLREALGDTAENPRFIQTLPRRGYRFIAPVEGNGTSSKPQAPPAVPVIIEPALEQPRSTAVKSGLSWRVACLILTVLCVVATWVAWRATRPVRQPLIRLSVDLGPDARTGLDTTVAISPDGTRIVFPARGPDGKQQLATRLLDQPLLVMLPGTENANDPFFSPDGRWLGFFADGQLKKISLEGGAAVPLCAAANGSGGSWGEDGTIIASLGTTSALSRVPTNGGPPALLTRLENGDGTHRWPQILPGGQAVLFTASVTTVGLDDATIEVMQLKTGKRKRLLQGGYFGRYLPSGHLVYVHQGSLFAVAFDLSRLEVRGTPVPVLEDVAGNPVKGGGQFDFSRTGIFVYLAGKSASQSWPVMWLDSSGKMTPLVATPGVYNNPRFSPDGRQLALTDGRDISVYDLGRDKMTRLTFTQHATVPVWSPDGKHIAFRSISNDTAELAWVRADGAGETRTLLATRNNVTPYSFSPDGRELAYFELNPKTRMDLWTLPLDLTDPDRPKPGKPAPFLETPFNELLPAFSGDGRWIAYRSEESGSSEIFVRPFPGPGGKWQISTNGGLYPIWSGNNRELFYETLDYRIMVVDYTVHGASFVFGKPRLWSDRQLLSLGVVNLALAPDGKRFAVFPIPQAKGGENAPVHAAFLLNFFDELRQRVPVSR
jgi:DNA-binding winged helix-turn-helix (wHTH) protein/Tol biopolymer transport system component